MYKIVLISEISIVKTDEGWKTIDLWSRDLFINTMYCDHLTLIAPSSKENSERSYDNIPNSIEVYTFDQVKNKNLLKSILLGCDVVQFGGGSPFWKCLDTIQIMHLSKRLHLCIIVGFSSNRIKSVYLNSKNRVLIIRIYSLIVSLMIRATALWFVMQADGLFLIGEGLRSAFSFGHKNIHIGTASWILKSDIISDSDFLHKQAGDRLRLCIASKLLPTKGIHVGLRAIKEIDDIKMYNISLAIWGSGEEENNLRAICDDFKISNLVSFNGTVSYGLDFSKAIGKSDIMLLTNLSDEQPRLIFDAIASGLLPVCPDNLAYKNLGIDERLLYSQGDSSSLASVIISLYNPDLRYKLWVKLREFCQNYTINSMHEKRSDFIMNTIRLHTPASI